MKTIKKFRDYDDDRYHRTKKQHHKGHQSKSKRKNWWEETPDDELDLDTSWGIVPQTETKTPQQQSQKQSMDYTLDIRGNLIDFSRLDDIQKVESEHNGRLTYGIKFIFKGNKGTFRIAWFNTNQDLRDQTYNEKVAFWQDVEGL